MKRLLPLFIGLITGVLIGWAMGYLRLPLIGHKLSFLVGFVACLAVVLLCYFIIVKPYQSTSTSLIVSKHSKSLLYNKILIVFLIILASSLSYKIYHQHKIISTHSSNNTKNFKENLEILASIKKEGNLSLLNNALNELDNELNDSTGSLSDELIERIATLSFSLKPYYYLKDDSLSKEKLSPERGTLLMALTSMNIDSVSFAKIKATSTFAYSDLNDVILSEINLSHINLMKASLVNAQLIGTNFNNANLNHANLWGCNLNNALLIHAKMQNANLEWAQLNRTNLFGAKLQGAKLKMSKMKQANAQNAKFNLANFNGAILENSNMKGADIYLAQLTNTNLDYVNFDSTRMTGVSISNSKMNNVSLNNVAVGKEWMEKIKKSQVDGYESIINNYYLIEESSNGFKSEKYSIRKLN